MRIGASLVVLIATAALLVADGCSGRKESAKTDTAANGTIAPAAAQPDVTGTEAMTQTVDVTDGRSEDEVATQTNGPRPSSAPAVPPRRADDRTVKAPPAAAAKKKP